MKYICIKNLHYPTDLVFTKGQEYTVKPLNENTFYICGDNKVTYNLDRSSLYIFFKCYFRYGK